MEYKSDIDNLIDLAVKILNSIKIQFCLQVTFSRQFDEIVTYQIIYFCTKNIILSNPRNSEIIHEISSELETKIEDFQERGSNWKVDSINKLDVKIGEYNIMYGGCHIELPFDLLNKKAIINIKSSYIKCFNRLLGTWDSNYHNFCENCLIGFKTKALLEKHRQCCNFFKPTLSLFPKEALAFFKNYRQMVEFPYVIYSDFECILKKIRKVKSNKTFSFQKHIACGYCLIVVNQENDVIYKNLYRGLDSAKVFLKDIKSQTEKLLKALLNYKEMNALTKNEEIEFLNAKICYICKEPFEKSKKSVFLSVKVHNHDHFTGKYIDAAHNHCNINFQ